MTLLVDGPAPPVDDSGQPPEPPHQESGGGEPWHHWGRPLYTALLAFWLLLLIGALPATWLLVHA
jgi:hypothetical protein